LTPNPTRRAEALGRAPPTIVSSVHPFFFVRTFAYGRKKIYLVLYYVGLRLLVYYVGLRLFIVTPPKKKKKEKKKSKIELELYPK
jgi:hypothetical protein